MKIDEKYFVPFLAIMAFMTALIIVFFTISNREGKEETFKKEIFAQDSLKIQLMPVINSTDSLGVISFPNKFVVVDFWATWTASFSKQAHLQLTSLKQKYPDKLEIIAAAVQDKLPDVQNYISRHRYPFYYVNGTQVFNKNNVPGVPTQLVYEPGGTLRSIFTGYADSTRMDSLRKILSHE